MTTSGRILKKFF